MSVFVYANNVSTTLASAAASGATTLVVASAAGIPTTIAAGTYFPLTLNDQATRKIYEIVYVTAVSGTTLTVLRAQEGTSAQNWSIGDYAFSAATAATLNSPTTGSLINVHTFTASGTYTPSPGMSTVLVYVQGGGGGSGGIAATMLNTLAAQELIPAPSLSGCIPPLRSARLRP